MGSNAFTSVRGRRSRAVRALNSRRGVIPTRPVGGLAFIPLVMGAVRAAMAVGRVISGVVRAVKTVKTVAQVARTVSAASRAAKAARAANALRTPARMAPRLGRPMRQRIARRAARRLPEELERMKRSTEEEETEARRRRAAAVVDPIKLIALGSFHRSLARQARAR